MTAVPFDPEAIARRVREREQQAPPPQPTLPPLARSEGACVTGTGTGATHLPLPVARHEPHDLHAQIEDAHQRRAIQSPLPPIEHPVEAIAVVVEREADEARFTAPDPMLDLQADLEELERTDPDVAAAASSYDAMVDRIVSQPPVEDEPPAEAETVMVFPVMDVLSALALVAAAVPVAPAPKPRAPRAPRAPRESSIDRDDVIARYKAGATIPQIARDLGRDCRGQLRQIINAAAARGELVKRDDRSGHSGRGQTVTDPPEMVDRIRRLYTLHGLTQHQVAEQIGRSAKYVQNVMARHGIQARPAVNQPGHGHPTHNPSADITGRLLAAGATNADVRAWARDNHMAVGIRGAVPRHLVDAYLAEHQEITS